MSNLVIMKNAVIMLTGIVLGMGLSGEGLAGTVGIDFSTAGGGFVYTNNDPVAGTYIVTARATGVTGAPRTDYETGYGGGFRNSSAVAENDQIWSFTVSGLSNRFEVTDFGVGYVEADLVSPSTTFTLTVDAGGATLATLAGIDSPSPNTQTSNDMFGTPPGSYGNAPTFNVLIDELGSSSADVLQINGLTITVSATNRSPSIYYRADNVDGVGHPGNANTTNLVNLANPGTHVGTIVNGSGVVANAGQSGTPFAYGVELTGASAKHIAANTFTVQGGVNKVTDATWEFWLRADSAINSARGALYGEFPAGTANNSRHYLSLQGIGTPTRWGNYDEYPNSGGGAASDSQMFETNTFTQIVFTKSGDTVTFYKNGVQVGATKTSSETYAGTAPNRTYFGKREISSGLYESFDGQFNIIRVYDTALSALEVVGNYNTEINDNTTAPALTGTNPLDNATNVSAPANLVATFSELIFKGTGNIELRKTSGGTLVESFDMATSTRLSVVNQTLTIDPTNPLDPGTEHYLLIPATAIKDRANNFFAGISDPTAWSFTTDGTAPTKSSMSPVADAIAVSRHTALTLGFNESVQKGAGTITLHLASDDSVVETINVTSGNVIISGSQVLIVRSLVLNENTAYYVNIAPGTFTDLSTNPYAGISGTTSWAFATGGRLVIHYRADNVDGAGNPGDGSTTTLVNLASPGTHNGTIVNGSGVIANAGQSGTPFAYGVELTGASAKHIAANTFTVQGGVNKVTDATWEFWLRADSAINSARGALYGEFPAGTANNSRHYLRLEGIGTVTRTASYSDYPGSGTTYVVSDSQLFTTAEFTQIVVTKSGDTVTFYKNGVQVGAAKTISVTYTGTAPNRTYFGKREINTGAYECFDGQFNIIRVYETALSPAEVRRNYNMEMPRGTLIRFY